MKAMDAILEEMNLREHNNGLNVKKLFQIYAILSSIVLNNDF